MLPQRLDLYPGRVKSSNRISQARACTPPSATAPHISTDACSCPHTAGRSGCPKILQRSCSSSCTQGTPAGLPLGMPGIGEEMDGAVQQAAQPGRQVKVIRFWGSGSALQQGPHLQGLLQASGQVARCRAIARVIVGPHGAHDGGAGVLGHDQPIQIGLGAGGLHPHRGAVGDAAAVHRNRALGRERHALCAFGAGRHAALGHGFFAEEHHTRVLPQQLGWSKGESIDTSTVGT